MPPSCVYVGGGELWESVGACAMWRYIAQYECGNNVVFKFKSFNFSSFNLLFPHSHSLSFHPPPPSTLPLALPSSCPSFLSSSSPPLPSLHPPPSSSHTCCGGSCPEEGLATLILGEVRPFVDAVLSRLLVGVREALGVRLGLRFPCCSTDSIFTSEADETVTPSCMPPSLRAAVNTGLLVYGRQMVSFVGKPDTRLRPCFWDCAS